MEDVEFKLLVDSCGVAVNGASIDFRLPEVRWDRFLALANRHRVQALCWHGLQKMEVAVPESAEATFKEQTRDTVITNLKAAQESNRLLSTFRAADVPLLFLKGLTVAALAYDDPFLKMSVDIDLLVEPQRIEKSSALLRNCGYDAVVPAKVNDATLVGWHRRRKESVWVRRDGAFQVDLHTRLADHPALLQTLGVASASQTVHVAAGIDLPTLADTELFAYLCVHGASSAWFRLKWITDLAAIMQVMTPGDIARHYRHSQGLGAGRAAAQALLLAERLYAIELGSDLRRGLEADPINQWLVRLAMVQLLNPTEPTDRLFGTATIHLSQLGLMPDWRFKQSEAARQLGNLLRRSS